MTESAHLYRLLYVSENRIEGDVAHVAREIEGILATSRRNNNALGLTGALIFNCGFFAQVLEGPRETVERIFEVIRHDPRHSKIQVMSAAEVEDREFPNWTMAYIGRSPSWEKALGWIKDDTHFAPDERCDRLFQIVMEMAYDSELSPDRSFAAPGKS
ncbi:BLUF domain-containing protein [Rhodopseudomonas palustris]|uniref:BLUF domain-containing protein n=1 Tax=Rhodopseudomonas palustris TaxID=1076 RepID=UPI000D1B9FB1|nr:BLUF domain-containing protein [Rhodopseudomonas palustris]AVT83137.1 phosphonate transporter [Rhodopseudomonas palustris]